MAGARLREAGRDEVGDQPSGPRQPLGVDCNGIYTRRRGMWAGVTEAITALSMLARLDIRSRTALRSFLFRLFLSTWMLLLVASFHKWPYRQSVGIFHLMCGVSALSAMSVALIRREKPQAATLNLWDEGLAFSALSLLALFLWRQAG